MSDAAKKAKPARPGLFCGASVAPRIASIVIGCLVLAFAFSYGTRGLAYLIVAPGGAEYNYAATIAEYLNSLASPLVFLEAILNGVILSIHLRLVGRLRCYPANGPAIGFVGNRAALGICPMARLFHVPRVPVSVRGIVLRGDGNGIKDS